MVTNGSFDKPGGTRRPRPRTWAISSFELNALDSCGTIKKTFLTSHPSDNIATEQIHSTELLFSSTDLRAARLSILRFSGESLSLRGPYTFSTLAFDAPDGMPEVTQMAFSSACSREIFSFFARNSTSSRHTSTHLAMSAVTTIETGLTSAP